MRLLSWAFIKDFWNECILSLAINCILSEIRVHYPSVVRLPSLTLVAYVYICTRVLVVKLDFSSTTTILSLIILHCELYTVIFSSLARKSIQTIIKQQITMSDSQSNSALFAGSTKLFTSNYNTRKTTRWAKIHTFESHAWRSKEVRIKCYTHENIENVSN